MRCGRYPSMGKTVGGRYSISSFVMQSCILIMIENEAIDAVCLCIDCHNLMVMFLFIG